MSRLKVDVVDLAILAVSGYTCWMLHNITKTGVKTMISPETQAQLDRIDAATTQIGNGVTTVAQRLVDLAGQIGQVDNTELNAALTAEADKLNSIGSDLTALASPSDPANPTA